MKIKLESDEQAVALVALSAAGLPVSHIERDSFSGAAEIFFTRGLTPGEQATADSAVAVALKKYRLRGALDFDPDGLHDMTLAQLNSYIDTKVTNLASARAFLKKLAALVFYLYKMRIDD